MAKYRILIFYILFLAFISSPLTRTLSKVPESKRNFQGDLSGEQLEGNYQHHHLQLIFYYEWPSSITSKTFLCKSSSCVHFSERILTRGKCLRIQNRILFKIQNDQSLKLKYLGLYPEIQWKLSPGMFKIICQLSFKS